jgi:heme-degrading monooxygenase HmoA
LLYIIWEFQVQKGKRRLFERYYSGKGKWAALFRKGTGYQGTFLFRDVDAPNRYFLADVWENLRSFRNFKRRFAAQYQTLDKKCEEFTLEEHCLGYFENSP